MGLPQGGKTLQLFDPVIRSNIQLKELNSILR